MNIVVHYPKTEQNKAVLRKKTAIVHAEAVIRHMQQLACPQKQRIKLYSEVKKACLDKR